MKKSIVGLISSSLSVDTFTTGPGFWASAFHQGSEFSWHSDVSLFVDFKIDRLYIYMALRSVLGKMGSSMTMTSSKCIHNNARLVLMLRNFDKQKIHDHSDNNKDVVSMSAANAYLFELGCYDANGVRIPMTVNRGFDYHMDLGGLGPARFAVEEFNKRKKSQLQFVRVQRTWMKPLYHCSCMYELVLEAVDATGVLNHYLAYVKIDDINEGMWLEEFHIFRDNGYPSRLYHYLDNFFVE